MKAWLISALHKLLPPVPDPVRAELAVLQFERLRGQVPFLNVTLILTVLAAMLAGSPSTPDWVRYGLPTFVMVFCAWRTAVWSGRRHRSFDASASERMIRRGTRLFILIASASSLWCVYTWFADASDYRHYAPVFLAMGAFSTTYCLWTVRGASIANLVVSMMPITGLLLSSGESLPTALGGSFLASMLFLVRMIMQQHDQLVAMLLLQRKMHEQARVDPLTGLLNRRALFEELGAAVGEAIPNNRPAVAILDLDNFKPVNDGYGHAVGDKLLQQVAERLQIICGSLVRIARLGGDEFAILAARPDHALTEEIIGAIEAALRLPFMVNDLQLRVGVSTGMAVWSENHIDMHCLLAEADQQLYAAKSARGGRGLRRSNFRASQR